MDYESYGLRGQFLFDLIPILPLEFIPLGGQERRFMLIKLVRLYTGLKIFYVPDIMDKIKVIFSDRLEWVIQHDSMAAEDQISD